MEILSIIQKTIKIRRYNESKSFFEFLNNNIIPNLKQHYKFKLLQTTTIHLGKKPNIKYKLIEINNLD